MFEAKIDAAYARSQDAMMSLGIFDLTAGSGMSGTFALNLDSLVVTLDDTSKQRLVEWDYDDYKQSNRLHADPDISENGVIKIKKSSGTQFGVVKIDDETIKINADGKISVADAGIDEDEVINILTNTAIQASSYNQDSIYGKIMQLKDEIGEVNKKLESALNGGK